MGKGKTAVFFAAAMMAVMAGTASADLPAQTETAVREALARMPASHPRLFATERDFAAVKERMNKDAFLREIAEKVRHDADAACRDKPLEHKLIGFRLLSEARRCLANTVCCAAAWRVYGDRKHFNAVVRTVDEAIALPDWNPQHYLDVAEFTLAAALAYDWLYDDLDAGKRAEWERGIVRLGMEPSWVDRQSNWWVKSKNNWTSVCHAGELAAALALKEVCPDLAEKTVLRAVHRLRSPAMVLSPDGNYPEGPGYWGYGVGFHVLAVDLLEKTLGSPNAFGLSDIPGWKETAEYRDLLTGSSGLFFNYSDGGSKREVHPAAWWFAKRYVRPDILVFREAELMRDAVRGGKATSRLFPLVLLWYEGMPGPDLKVAIPRAWTARGVTPLAVQRSGWGRDDLFAALKGGTPSENHGHMDVGSFVLDSDGVRWACDLGAEGYHRIESRGMKLWSSAQESDRWRVYRLNALSHNTLMIDGAMQKVKGFAKVVESETGPGPRAVLDLSPLYEGSASKVLRSGTMSADGRSWKLEDRLEGLREGATVRWAMMTKAKVAIDGAKVVLTQGRKRIELVRSGTDAPWKVESAPTPNPWDSPNSGYWQLTFAATAPADGRLCFAVEFKR